LAASLSHSQLLIYFLLAIALGEFRSMDKVELRRVSHNFINEFAKPENTGNQRESIE